MATESINGILILAGFLLFVSVLASALSRRSGMPLLLIFLAVGMLAGEDGLGGIEFNDYSAVTFVSQLALAIILMDGGLRAPWGSFRLALGCSSILATWGVIATALILSLFVMVVFDVDWIMALLMASIVGSTDAAAVFNLLRNSGVRLNPRVQSTLEVESGANDPMAILLVTIIVSYLTAPDSVTWASAARTLVEQLSYGIVFGAAGGLALSALMKRLVLNEGMYSLLILSGGVLVFSLTSAAGGSGFLAAFVAGVFVGNQKRRATESALNVFDGFAWLSQAALFLILGLFVKPSDVWHYAAPSFLIALFLAVVARPVATMTVLPFFGFSKREMAFISWVGLRGAVPVTLAIVPLASGVENSSLFLNVTFAVVILSLAVQGASIPWFARKMKVVIPNASAPAESRALWVTPKTPLSMHAFFVDKEAELNGRSIGDVALRLDHPDAQVIALARNDKIMRLEGDLTLATNDKVWIAMPDELTDKACALFGNLDQTRKKDADFYGEFVIDPDTPMDDLCAVYGWGEALKESSGMTALQYMRKRHGASLLAQGDKVKVGDFELSVRSVDAKGVPEKIGLKAPRATNP